MIVHGCTKVPLYWMVLELTHHNSRQFSMWCTCENKVVNELLRCYHVWQLAISIINCAGCWLTCMHGCAWLPWPEWPGNTWHPLYSLWKVQGVSIVMGVAIGAQNVTDKLSCTINTMVIGDQRVMVMLNELVSYCLFLLLNEWPQRITYTCTLHTYIHSLPAAK